MGQIQWFGHTECEDDGDWFKWCMMIRLRELDSGDSLEDLIAL